MFKSFAYALWKRGEASVEKLLQILLQIDIKELAKTWGATKAQSVFDPTNPRTVRLVRDMVIAYIKPLSWPSSDKKPFSIREWIEDGKSSILFLTSNAATHESQRPSIIAQIEMALMAQRDRPKGKGGGHWFLIDDLASLHKIPSLVSGLCESKQFGTSFVLGAQSISELREIYGDDALGVMAENCNTRLAFSTSDKDTQTLCAEALGNTVYSQDVELVDTSLNAGLKTHFSSREAITEPLVRPEDLQALNSLTGYLKMSNNKLVAKVKLKPKNRSVVGPKFVKREVTDPSTGADVDQEPKNTE